MIKEERVKETAGFRRRQGAVTGEIKSPKWDQIKRFTNFEVGIKLLQVTKIPNTKFALSNSQSVLSGLHVTERRKCKCQGWNPGNSGVQIIFFPNLTQIGSSVQREPHLRK